jgi:archaeosine-15-forming tRNA-guanine transglycosylase
MISFKDMKPNVVYTCLGPKGLFVRYNNEVWFKSYFNGAQRILYIVNGGKHKILSETEHRITEKNGEPVFPKQVTLIVE